jgi:hypothetical protein
MSILAKVSYRFITIPTKVNTRLANNPTNKWSNELTIRFSNEEVQMANKYKRKCSKSLAIR